MSAYPRQDKYRKANPEKYKEIRRQYARRLKEEIVRVYGGVCACCGENKIEFLCIDHTNGGGTKERKELGRRGHHFYHYLRRTGYPKGYRVLCHNCNMSLGSYGYCPHSK